LQAHRESVDDVQIPRHDRVDAGPANLHHHALTGVERRRVHLRDRGRRQRDPVKAGKHVIDLRP
jgi:hypothetical protein